MNFALFDGFFGLPCDLARPLIYIYIYICFVFVDMCVLYICAYDTISDSGTTLIHLCEKNIVWPKKVTQTCFFVFLTDYSFTIVYLYRFYYYIFGGKIYFIFIMKKGAEIFILASKIFH